MLLTAAGVKKSYAGIAALRHASFELLAGEVHALVGENGAGKSTLIKIFTGAVIPDAGTLHLNGTLIENNSPHRSRSLGIVAIYQQPALFPDLTVSENLALSSEPSSLWRILDWKSREARARKLLAEIGGRIEPNTLVSALSMAEQQIVEIARALGGEAKVLILDEPTAALTESETRNLFGIIRGLRARGVGIVYISHRLEELFEIADRVTVLRDGEVIGTRAMTDVDRPAMIRMMVGRELSAVFPKREAAIGPVVLEARQLRSREARLRDVSLSLHQGEILGLAGIVGAGRTEFAETLFGLTPADGGEVLIDGCEQKIASPGRAVELGLAYVPEDRRRHGVIMDMPLPANITMASLGSGFLDGKRERRLAQEYKDRLQVKSASMTEPVRNLSGGNQQKVALGRWLATNPRILILDEPTQGIDVGAKSEIHQLMGSLAAQGMAIIMISSELPEILGMSDRIAVMRGGAVAGMLTRAEATQEKILALALMKRERAASLAWAALLLILAIFAPSFYASGNLRDLFLGMVPVLITAMGMTMVIVARQIDISIGSQFAVCGVVAGLLAAAGVPMPLVAVLVCLAGAALGFLNGALVAALGVPSIVATLATMVVIRQTLLWNTGGAWVRDLPATFQWFGLGQGPGQAVILAFALLLFGIFAWASRNVAVARTVYAAGSDAEAARLSGIDTRAVLFGVFTLMGALTGLAALLDAVRFSDVQGNAGVGLELKAIAAVVVGGASINGGRGTLVGTLLGVGLLGTIGPALTFLGINPFWEKAIQGGIILAAIVADHFASRALALRQAHAR